MKDNSNALNKYKSTINIKSRDMLAASRTSDNFISTDASTIKPEITTNSYSQDESGQQNVFRLTTVVSKEGILEGITKIVGKDITNPILRTMDN